MAKTKNKKSMNKQKIAKIHKNVLMILLLIYQNGQVQKNV
jgi:hypothetical protein